MIRFMVDNIILEELELEYRVFDSTKQNKKGPIDPRHYSHNPSGFHAALHRMHLLLRRRGGDITTISKLIEENNRCLTSLQEIADNIYSTA